jgi:hypothetical protein
VLPVEKPSWLYATRETTTNRATANKMKQNSSFKKGQERPFFCYSRLVVTLG